MKILIVNGGMLDYGGVSSYIMNYYRKMDKKGIKIDFVVQGSGKCMFVDEIMHNGGNVFFIPNKSHNLINHVKKLNFIIKNGQYDIVHAHTDAANGFILKIAKKNKVKCRISHSHSTNYYTKSKVKMFFNNYQKKMVVKYATDLWGCSIDACRWLYGDNKFEIINNAIDLNKFKFNPNTRNVYRKLLRIEKTYAICQVGHFNYIKNQQFSIKVIEELKKRYPEFDFKFYFIGTGEESEIKKIKKKISKNIEDNIIFLGRRNDVADLLQAMDILLMPSIFEGFPVSLVESQASDIKAIISEKITESVNLIPGTIAFLPINDTSIIEWVSKIITEVDKERKDESDILTKKGFNIEIEANKLRDKYLRLMEK